MEGEDQHFRFLDLPPEIRNMIYEYALDEGLAIQVHRGSRDFWPSKVDKLVFWSDLRPLYPPLTRVNQQIRSESSCFPIHIPVQVTFFLGLVGHVRHIHRKRNTEDYESARRLCSGVANKRDVDSLENALDSVMEAQRMMQSRGTYYHSYAPKLAKNLSEADYSKGKRGDIHEELWKNRVITK